MHCDATLLFLSYQQTAYVEEAARSVLGQQGCRLRILLSDDASTDGSYEKLEPIAAGYQGPHQVELRRQSSRVGLVEHVNALMRETTTDLVLLAASDDNSRPDRALRLLQVWRSKGEPKVYLTSDAQTMDEQGRPGERRCAEPPPNDVALLERVRSMGAGVLGCTGAFHREVWAAFGPVKVARQVEDRPLAFRAAAFDGILHVPEPLVDYRVHGKSLSQSPGQSPMAPEQRRRRWDFQVQIFGQFSADLAHPAFVARYGSAAVDTARQEARQRCEQAQWGLDYLGARGWRRWRIIAQAGVRGRSARRLLGWSWETLRSRAAIQTSAPS